MRHLSLAILSLILLGGCSSSLKTVKVPASEPTIRYKPPEVELGTIPPAPPPGVPSEPISIDIYPSATGPTLDVELVSVDRSGEAGRVVIQYQAGDSTYRETYAGPAHGEILDIQPDTIVQQDTSLAGDTVATAQVRGEPVAQEVQAKVTESRSWWGRQWDHAVSAFALVGVLAVFLTAAGAALRFTSLSLPL